MMLIDVVCKCAQVHKDVFFLRSHIFVCFVIQVEGEGCFWKLSADAVQNLLQVLLQRDVVPDTLYNLARSVYTREPFFDDRLMETETDEIGYRTQWHPVAVLRGCEGHPPPPVWAKISSFSCSFFGKIGQLMVNPPPLGASLWEILILGFYVRQ